MILAGLDKSDPQLCVACREMDQEWVQRNSTVSFYVSWTEGNKKEGDEDVAMQ